MTTSDETGSILRQVEVTTIDGNARASFVIDKPGKVEVHAVSEPAVVSDVIQFDATNEGVAVTVVVPVVTTTPEPPTPTPTVVPENNFISPEGYPRAGIWFLMLLGVLGSALLVFWAVSRVIAPRWGCALRCLRWWGDSGHTTTWRWVSRARWRGSHPNPGGFRCTVVHPGRRGVWGHPCLAVVAHAQRIRVASRLSRNNTAALQASAASGG
jgi:hypothetical protein